MADGTVFIINGDDAVRDSMHLLLETHALAVRDCPDPAEFLAAFGAKARGCLVLDDEMAGGDGLAWLRAARASGVKLPAVLLTDQKAAALERAAAEIGSVTVVTKPPEEDALIDAVRAALNGGV